MRVDPEAKKATMVGTKGVQQKALGIMLRRAEASPPLDPA
jgi:hypothetical protein